MYEATPHTRGSTRFAVSFLSFPGGYPAYAGIDPVLCILSSVVVGLPRIRGDRPLA